MITPLMTSSALKWHYETDIEKLNHYDLFWQDCIKHTCISLFSSQQWINCWKNTFWKEKNSLHLFIVLDNEKCVLFAPFYIHTQPTFPFTKTLTLLGQGELEVCEVSSEYQDILLHPDYEYLLPSLALKLESLNFDQVNIRALLNDANLLALFSYIDNSAVNEAGIKYTYMPEDSPSPALSKNYKSKLNKCKNKLTALNAKYIWVQEKDYDNYWEVMKKFHQKRWTKLGKKGAFSHTKFSRFHNEFRKKHNQNIKISAVIVNNTPIAIHYYFISDNTLCFYQSGWDEEKYANTSPSFALHIWCMNNSNEIFYDLMMGNPKNSYKAKLGCNRISKMYNILLIRNKLKIRLTKLINKFKKS